MRVNINKKLIIISFEIQKWLCYKSEFLFTFIIPIINFLIQLFLWNSLYKYNNFNSIGGYEHKEIIRYYFWINTISTISASNAAAIGTDIKNGNIDKELLRPMSVLKFRFWSNIGNRFPYILIVYIVLLICFFSGFYVKSQILLGAGAFMIGIGMLISFYINMLIGLLALYIEEVWVVTAIINFIKNFLAGAYIPLSFLPTMITGILTMTPLAYMSYYPVEIILSRVDLSEILNIVLIGIFWLIVLHLVISFIIKRLFDRYQSAGG